MTDQYIVQVGVARDYSAHYARVSRELGYKSAVIIDPSHAAIEERAAMLQTDYFDFRVWAKSAETQDLSTAVKQVPGDIVRIIPGFELFSLDSTLIAEEVGVERPNPSEVIKRFRRKDLQRQYLQEQLNGAYQPRFVIISRFEELAKAAETIGYPCVIKPADSGGSKGVYRIDGPDALAKAWQQASQPLDNDLESCGFKQVEELLEEPEVSIQGFMMAGKPTLLTYSEKIITHGPDGKQFVERQHLISPARYMPEAARRFAEEIIGTLGLERGPFYLDSKITPTGYKLLETGARLSGNHIPDLMLMMGIDWPHAALNSYLDLASDSTQYAETDFFGVVTIITPKKRGRVLGYEIEGGLPQVCVVNFQPFGDEVKDVDDKVGTVMAVHEEKTAVRKMTTQALDKIKVLT